MTAKKYATLSYVSAKENATQHNVKTRKNTIITGSVRLQDALHWVKGWHKRGDDCIVCYNSIPDHSKATFSQGNKPLQTAHTHSPETCAGCAKRDQKIWFSVICCFSFLCQCRERRDKRGFAWRAKSGISIRRSESREAQAARASSGSSIWIWRQRRQNKSYSFHRDLKLSRI